jgi:hypothetical protein
VTEKMKTEERKTKKIRSKEELRKMLKEKGIE